MEQSARGMRQLNPNEPGSAGAGRITEAPHQMVFHDGYGAATIGSFLQVALFCSFVVPS